LTESTDRLAEFDLTDPDTFLAEVPHALFARLRREDPVHFHPEQAGRGFWAVTRYEDIRTVHRDAATFSSEIGGGTLIEDLDPEQIEARKSMIDTDPPRHSELRVMVNRRFTPRAASGWEDRIRDITVTVLDSALPLGEFDFVAQISSELPARVIAEVLGVPVDQRREIVDLSNRIVGRQDPEFESNFDESSRLLSGGSQASLELFELGRRLAALSREDPTDDLISQLASEDLTEREFDNYFGLLAVGGNETTRHTITHALIALTERPEMLERLRSEPALLETAVDEFLRWATPIHYFRRTATCDVELGGSQIKAGDKVITWLASGNRDETVFPEPDHFDITRTPNPHMAFGPGGIHHCLGKHVAHLEIRVFFEELLSRPVELELAGPPERLRSNVFNGIKRLPVRVS
jgi:cytochrome P450